jgi:hypothetical protein
MELVCEALGDLRILPATAVFVIFASSKAARNRFLVDSSLVSPHGVELDNFRVQKGRKIIFCFCTPHMSIEDIEAALGALNTEIASLPRSFCFVYTEEVTKFTSQKTEYFLRGKMKSKDTLRFAYWRKDGQRFEESASFADASSTTPPPSAKKIPIPAEAFSRPLWIHAPSVYT